MGNLRPAPANLTPQRVDALIGALDNRDRRHSEETLRRLGLPDAEIGELFALAAKINRHPLATAGGLIGAVLENMRSRG